MRKAIGKLSSQGKSPYYIQCTTRKDKKQVTFIHTHLVQNGEDIIVKRHVKNERHRVDIKAPVI